MTRINLSEKSQGEISELRNQAIEKVKEFLHTTNYKIEESKKFLVDEEFVNHVSIVGKLILVQITDEQAVKILEDKSSFSNFHYSDIIEKMISGGNYPPASYNEEAELRDSLNVSINK